MEPRICILRCILLRPPPHGDGMQAVHALRRCGEGWLGRGGSHPPNLNLTHPAGRTPACPVLHVRAGLGLRLDGFSKEASVTHEALMQPAEEIMANWTLTHIVGTFSGLKKKNNKKRTKKRKNPRRSTLCQMCEKPKVLRAAQGFISGKDLEGGQRPAGQT